MSTTKEKYSRLNMAEVPEKAKAIIEKMKKDTNNFTDKDALKVIEPKFDEVFERLKSNYPKAIKSASKSAAKKPDGRAKKSSTFDLAKKIRKAGESWQDAVSRASRQNKGAAPSAPHKPITAKKKASNALKLKALLASSKELRGRMKGVDKEKDAGIHAIKPGKRISKSGVKNQFGTSRGGKVYYEYRANRADFMKRKNYPFLKDGGEIKNTKHKED